MGASPISAQHVKCFYGLLLAAMSFYDKSTGDTSALIYNECLRAAIIVVCLQHLCVKAEALDHAQSRTETSSDICCPTMLILLGT